MKEKEFYPIKVSYEFYEEDGEVVSECALLFAGTLGEAVSIVEDYLTEKANLDIFNICVDYLDCAISVPVLFARESAIDALFN